MNHLGKTVKLIVFALAATLISACGTNTVKIDSYCESLIVMRGYLWIEGIDKQLFDEIHGNMKRYENRGC